MASAMASSFAKACLVAAARSAAKLNCGGRRAAILRDGVVAIAENVTRSGESPCLMCEYFYPVKLVHPDLIHTFDVK